MSRHRAVLNIKQNKQMHSSQKIKDKIKKNKRMHQFFLFYDNITPYREQIILAVKPNRLMKN